MSLFQQLNNHQLKNEPRKDVIDIKQSLEKITYISYLTYKAVIPKPPEDVRLCDVKNAFPLNVNLEYYFKARDSTGNIIYTEIDDDKQSIPLLDGMIILETVPSETKVYFQILDETRYEIKRFYWGPHLRYRAIPKSVKKSKTLKDVKKAIPGFLQEIFNEGKSIRYFFNEDNVDDGLIKKELFLDFEEIPVIEGRDDIICSIIVSPDVRKKLGQLSNHLWLKILTSIFILVSIAFCSHYFYPNFGTILLCLISFFISVILFCGIF